MKWSLKNIVIAGFIVFIFVLPQPSLFAQGIRITSPSLGTQGKPACVVLPVKVEWEINNEKDKKGVLQAYLYGKLIFPKESEHAASVPGTPLPLEVGKAYEIKVWIPGAMTNASGWVEVKQPCEEKQKN